MTFNHHENKINLKLDDPIITHDKCQKCKDVLYIDEIEPDYKGMVSTYGHDSYCTLACFKPRK